MSTVENNNSKKYECTICNKNYKDKSGLWYHNKKVHNPKVTLNSNPESSQSNHTVIPKSSINNDPDENVDINSNKYECKKCNKKFKYKQGRWKHEQTCKGIIETNLKEENELLKNTVKKQSEELKQQSDEIKEVKSMLLDLMNKNCKVHHKTLQKINKQLNNNGTINNGTIINNTFVKFGNLSYDGLLTDQQQRDILNKQYLSLEESIKQIHFNKNLPEYNNVYITNMKDDIAYIFNGVKFISIRKNDMLTQLINMHIDEINFSFEKNKGKLKEKYVERLEKFLSDLNSSNKKFVDEQNQRTYPNYKAYKINAIKLLIYNESDAKKLAELTDGNIELIEKNTELSDTNEIEV